MSDKTEIEWTDATWNPITGCSVLSAGCTNCYAMTLAGGRLRHHASRTGLTRESGGRQVWTGEVRLNEEWLDQPLRWRRPRMIFVCAHGDLFHENVPDWWIDQVFAVMAASPRHTFQVLTKRPERMREYMARDDRDEAVGYAAMGLYERWGDPVRGLNHAMTLTHRQGYSAPGTISHCCPKQPSWPLTNVWLGVSVEDQATANERIPSLLDTPAEIRWVSAEPLLWPVDLTSIDYTAYMRQFRPDAGTHEYDPVVWLDALRGHFFGPDDTGLPHIDWVVAGGESGPKARPMHPDWVRDLRDQCTDAGVPFLFKQWGEWLPADQAECPMGPAHEWRNLAGERPRSFQSDEMPFMRSGKKRAGRILDGRTHDEYPV